MPVITFDRDRSATDIAYTMAWVGLAQDRFQVDPGNVAATDGHCPPTLIVDDVSVTFVFDEYIRPAIIDYDRNIAMAEHRQLRSDITPAAPFSATVFE